MHETLPHSQASILEGGWVSSPTFSHVLHRAQQAHSRTAILPTKMFAEQMLCISTTQQALQVLYQRWWLLADLGMQLAWQTNICRLQQADPAAGYEAFGSVPKLSMHSTTCQR